MSLGENSLVAAYQGKGQLKSRPSGTWVVTYIYIERERDRQTDRQIYIYNSPSSFSLSLSLLYRPSLCLPFSFHPPLFLCLPYSICLSSYLYACLNPSDCLSACLSVSINRSATLLFE